MERVNTKTRKSTTYSKLLTSITFVDVKHSFSRYKNLLLLLKIYATFYSRNSTINLAIISIYYYLLL